MLHKFYLFLFWCFALFSFCLQAQDCLEMRVFKAGQANAIVLKLRDHAIVVDCGGLTDGGVLDSVKEFVESIMHVSVIVTHQHGDHFDKIPDVFATKQIEKLIVGGNAPTRAFADTVREEHGRIPASEFVEVSSTSAARLGVLLDNVLPGATVSCLLPHQPLGPIKVLSSTTGQTDYFPHRQNLIVKVICEGVSVILPGDSDGRMITAVAEGNPGCFSDIDVFVMPHHGSIENAEYRLYQMLFENTYPPCVSIIPGDSDGRHKLPDSTVTALGFLPISKVTDLPRPIYSWSDIHTFKAYCATSARSEEFSVGRKPLFITSDATAPYYKAKLASDGFITLHDGEADTPQFFGFKSSATAEAIARRLSSELSNFRVINPEYSREVSGVLKNLFCNEDNADPVETLGFRAEVTGLWKIPLNRTWINFLWECKLLNTADSKPIANLANLLIAYIKLQEPLRSGPGQPALPDALLTQERMLKKFEECKETAQFSVKRRAIAIPTIAGVLELSDDDFLLWVNDKAKSILDKASSRRFEESEDDFRSSDSDS